MSFLKSVFASRGDTASRVGQLARRVGQYAQAQHEAESDRERHLRGARLKDLTSPEAQARVAMIDTGEQHPVRLGGVPLERAGEQQHVLLAGAPGTGKSVALKQLLRSVRARGEQAIVYDPAGEFTAAFYRPGVDVIVNPLDRRHTHWSPWRDFERQDWKTAAEVLVKADEKNPFFQDAARALLVLLARQSADVDDLLRLGVSEPTSKLIARIERAGLSGVIGGKESFTNVRATLNNALEAFYPLPPCSVDESFSLDDWIDDSEGRWIFLPVRKNQQNATRGLMTLFLNTLVTKVLSREPDRSRRIWTVIDEFPSLQKMTAVEEGLAEGRKFGLTFALGIQATGQVKARYGREAGSALLSMPRNRLIMRVSDAESAEDASKELGDQHKERTKITRSEGSNSSSNSGPQGGGSSGSNRGTSTSTDDKTERVVLPSEIAGLPDLRAFLRIGTETVYKVAIGWQGLPAETQPGVIPVPMRELPWERDLSDDSNAPSSPAQPDSGAAADAAEDDVYFDESAVDDVDERAIAVLAAQVPDDELDAFSTDVTVPSDDEIDAMSDDEVLALLMQVQDAGLLDETSEAEDEPEVTDHE